MSTHKPTQHLLLITQEGLTLALPSPEAESAQRRYRLTPFTPGSLPISVSAALLCVSARRSVSKELRASLRSLRARRSAPPVLVYLAEVLFLEDELLDLVEQEVRALLEETSFAANEVAFFRGEAGDAPRLLAFLDEALPARDSELESATTLAQALLAQGPAPEVSEARLADLIRALHPAPLPLYWLEMLWALRVQRAKKVELGFVCDWSFFQRLSQTSLLPLHCDLYPYAYNSSAPYTPRRTFFLVYQDRPFAALLTTSSYELCQTSSMGVIGAQDQFVDAQRLSLMDLFQRCQQERLPIQGRLFVDMPPKKAVVWMVRGIHDERLSERTVTRSPQGDLGERREALTGLGRPSSREVSLEGLTAALRALLAPMLAQEDGLISRLLAFLLALFSRGGAEVRSWHGDWTYLLGGGNRLWTVSLPEKEWVVTLFFDERA